MEELIHKSYDIYTKGSIADFVALIYPALEKIENSDVLIFCEDDCDVEEFYFYLENINSDLTEQISFLRAVMVALMVKSKEFLKGTTEMSILTPDNYSVDDIKYYSYVANSEELIKLYQIFIVFYHLQTEKKNLICFDFEFTLKKNELLQQSFESEESPIYFLWIVKLAEFNATDMKRFLKYILLNKKILKVLHGSDSLDMPFIQEILLENNKDDITTFLKQMVDTRFLCEYYKVSQNDVANKCSIYDALLYFGVMTKEQHEILMKNIDDMGPHQDIRWDIHKLGRAQEKYALYDVLYLRQFYLKIIKLGGESYEGLITDIERFIYMERKEISNIHIRCKAEVDPINNYMIRDKKIVNLIILFNIVMKNVILPLENGKTHEIDKLLGVNFFKSPFTYIFKKIVYSIASHKYSIYKDKMTRYPDKLSLKFIFDFLDENNFVHIKYMLEQFVILMTNRIIAYMK